MVLKSKIIKQGKKKKKTFYKEDITVLSQFALNTKVCIKYQTSNYIKQTLLEIEQQLDFEKYIILVGIFGMSSPE